MFENFNLNKEQQMAVNALSGPVLVVAGAGSGKTRVLTFRILNLIKQQIVNPENILAITFTNKATNEMRQRLAPVDPQGRIHISTFHSLCAKILRDFIFNLEGYTKYFTIYNEDDRNKLLKKIIGELNYDAGEFLKNVQYHISNAKNIGLNYNEYAVEYAYITGIDKIVKVFESYENQMRKNNALDFDDLLVKTYELLRTKPHVLHYLQDKYKYIHIDEFQDTNTIQYKIIKLLSMSHRNLFVVGDEDQCIYGWRGASIENTNLFVKDFNPVIIKLEQNYRSVKSVLDIANKLIKNNRSRIEKNLWSDIPYDERVIYYKAFSDQDETDYVVRQIYNLINVQGVKPSEIAILFRLGALSRPFEEKLLNYNIEYSLYGAVKFFERVEVRNILSYLLLPYNPNDNEALKRIINYPKRGIGKTTVEKLELHAEQHNLSLYNVITNIEDQGFTKSIVDKILPFKELLLNIENYVKEGHKASEIFKYVVETSQIKEQYSTMVEEDNDRLLNIGQLQNSINTFEFNNPESTLIDFLQSVTLESQIDDNEEDASGKVVVSTVHAVKGLEFTAVFIVGVEEGLFPISRAFSNPDEIEEERRLMYVAVTRSKKHLTITSADNRYLYSSRNNMIPSRFLTEMELIKKQPQRENNYSISHTHYKTNFGGGVYDNYTENILGNDASTNIYANAMNGTGANLQPIITKKLDTQSKNFDKFKVGVQVLHPKFGIGTITKSNIESGNNSVEVMFSGLGHKTLNLEFAPLQIIPNKNND